MEMSYIWHKKSILKYKTKLYKVLMPILRSTVSKGYFGFLWQKERYQTVNLYAVIKEGKKETEKKETRSGAHVKFAFASKSPFWL